MSVTFAGKNIRGTNHRVTTDPPELQRRELHYWGVVGAGELRGLRKSRRIEIAITLHNNFANYAALRNELANLDTYVGLHGQLVVQQTGTNGVSRTFPNCTFLGFRPGEAPTDGPLPDVAGTLETPAGKWWITGTLVFAQLRDK